jgi:hypothetical protein
MTGAQATAEIFLRALKSLPKKDRDEVLVRIARDKEFARDLAVIAGRRGEPSRPFRDYLHKKSK